MEKTPPRRVPLWLKLLLAASLALNLLIVGLVAGAFWRQADGPGARYVGPGPQSYAAPYVRALPRAERQALGRAIRAEHPRREFKARRESYVQALAALRATPFDAETLRNVMEEQSRAVLALQETAQGRWFDIIADMSPADRVDYADRLEEQLTRRGKPRRPAE